MEAELECTLEAILAFNPQNDLNSVDNVVWCDLLQMIHLEAEIQIEPNDSNVFEVDTIVFLNKLHNIILMITLSTY